MKIYKWVPISSSEQVGFFSYEITFIYAWKVPVYNTDKCCQCKMHVMNTFIVLCKYVKHVVSHDEYNILFCVFFIEEKGQRPL